MLVIDKKQSSNLFEDTEETEEGQDDVESNADDNIQEQDVTSEKLPESDDKDNTIDSQLTNSTQAQAYIVQRMDSIRG